MEKSSDSWWLGLDASHVSTTVLAVELVLELSCGSSRVEWVTTGDGVASVGNRVSDGTSLTTKENELGPLTSSLQ